MSFEAQLTGFYYCNDLTGKGWPDYVTLDNGGILSAEYETRTYYPADVRALLELADEMQGHADAEDYGGDGRINAGCLWSYADRIRDALGVTDG